MSRHASEQVDQASSPGLRFGPTMLILGLLALPVTLRRPRFAAFMRTDVYSLGNGVPRTADSIRPYTTLGFALWALLASISTTAFFVLGDSGSALHKDVERALFAFAMASIFCMIMWILRAARWTWLTRHSGQSGVTLRAWISVEWLMFSAGAALGISLLLSGSLPSSIWVNR